MDLKLCRRERQNLRKKIKEMPVNKRGCTCNFIKVNSDLLNTKIVQTVCFESARFRLDKIIIF